MNLDDILLSPGISCIQIESSITCYGVNANHSVCLLFYVNIKKYLNIFF
jgi:hypothetical protein